MKRFRSYLMVFVLLGAVTACAPASSTGIPGNDWFLGTWQKSTDSSNVIVLGSSNTGYIYYNYPDTNTLAYEITWTKTFISNSGQKNTDLMIFEFEYLDYDLVYTNSNFITNNLTTNTMIMTNYLSAVAHTDYEMTVGDDKMKLCPEGDTNTNTYSRISLTY